MSKSTKRVALSILTATAALALAGGAQAGPEKTDKTKAEPTTETAKPAKEIPAPTVDTNGDGKADAWDRNNDGKPDVWDKDGDGKPDAVDNNGDGQPDA